MPALRGDETLESRSVARGTFALRLEQEVAAAVQKVGSHNFILKAFCVI